jgi:hypothetical protein
MPASICRPGSPLATHIAVGDRDGVTRGSVPFCAVENRLLHFDPQRIFRAGSALDNGDAEAHSWLGETLLN